MADGLTQPLFPDGGEMMEFELWEGMQRNVISLLEVKFTLNPRQKVAFDGKAWTQDLSLAPVGHRKLARLLSQLESSKLLLDLHSTIWDLLDSTFLSSPETSFLWRRADSTMLEGGRDIVT